MDFCSHKNIDGEICSDCGMRIVYNNFYEQPYMSNNNLNIPPRVSFYKKLTDMGINKKLIMEGEKCIDILAEKKINLKGNRKKAIIILRSFDLDKCIDIERLIKTLNINKTVFNNATILYEKYINVIDYGIKDLTNKYLFNKNRLNTEILVQNYLSGLTNIHSKQNICHLLDRFTTNYDH